jgi:hypothetical protein
MNHVLFTSKLVTNNCSILIIHFLWQSDCIEIMSSSANRIPPQPTYDVTPEGNGNGAFDMTAQVENKNKIWRVKLPLLSNDLLHFFAV